jgi:hypothetical protein
MSNAWDAAFGPEFSGHSPAAFDPAQPGAAWLPPDQPEAERAYWLAAFPGDPHGAAAAAWESWAATLAATEPAGGGEVQSVQTGAQSVTYANPRSPAGKASERAAWHWARAKVKSVPVGPGYAWRNRREIDEDTYPSPPIAPTGPAQINLPDGSGGYTTVGPRP